MKFKYILSFILVSFVSFIGNSQNQYGLPAEIKNGNILHCFDWKMTDVKNELPQIAEAGFVAVQISPTQRNVNAGAIWYDVYRPYDFKFIGSNGIGQASDLISLCEEAEKYGIKIIVDVVFNHVDKNPYRDSWWNLDNRDRNVNTGINYGSRYSITHDNLGNGQYSEVNSENAEVVSRAKAYIEELKSYGVKGIRFDAAKHIALPSEGTDFWKEITSVPGMFYYGEILGNPGGANSSALMKEYTDYMSVTDEEYSTNARNGSGVPSTTGNWDNKGIDSSKLVFWGESHDTYSNTPEYGGVTNKLSQNLIDKAYAILACRNNGIGLYFSRPTSNNTGNIKVGQKGSTHFTSREVAEVNKFKNEMTGKADSYTFNSSVGCVTRQNGGAVIVSKSANSDVEISNGNSYCPPGTYYDRVSGNEFTVTASTIKGKMGSTGIAVIYGDFVPDDDFEFDTGSSDEGKVFIYNTNPNNWNKVYVYLYVGNNNNGWPGEEMTKQGNLWVYEVPEAFHYNCRVMFNDGGSNKYPGDIDGVGSDGFLLNGKSMISDGTGEENWKEYTADSGVGDVVMNEDFDFDTALWFNLQGQKINRPTEKGIYIIYSPSGKTKKVLI